MNIAQHKSIVRTIRQDDPDFKIQDGFALVPRAMFHILPNCPAEYKHIIERCVANGWLKPVAHVKDYELMLDRLHE